MFFRVSRKLSQFYNLISRRSECKKCIIYIFNKIRNEIWNENFINSYCTHVFFM